MIPKFDKSKDDRFKKKSGQNKKTSKCYYF